MSSSERTTVDLGRFLNHGAVDRAIRATGAFGQSGWRPGTEVTLDLETVEFVDFAAATRIVTLTEGLVRADRRVDVILPIADRRDREQRFLDSRLRDLPEAQQDRVRRDLEERVNARRRARSFIRHIGMTETLRLQHLPPGLGDRIRVLDRLSGEDARTESGSGDGLRSVVGGSGVRTFPAILPLQWIRDRDQLYAEGWQGEAIDFLFDQGLVVTRSDAESLVTTVFRELIENVLDHSSDRLTAPPGALFGAVTLNRLGSRYKPNDRDAYESQHDYLHWLADQDSPIVRVVVGDSGLGLAETLRTAYRASYTVKVSARTMSPAAENANIVQHAFEPNVSCQAVRYRRGVGLTIVRRFVRSYRGMTNVRTSNVCPGFECHSDRPSRIAELSLQYVPGTSVELFFGLGLRNRDRARGERLESVDLKDLVVLDAGVNEAVATLVSRALNEVENVSGARLPIVILQMDGWPRDREARTELALGIREVAAGLEGNAALAVVFDAASDVDCDTVFRTMDDLSESLDADTGNAANAAAWYPPFLIMSATGRPLWSGGTTMLRGLLYRMLEGETIGLDDPDVTDLSGSARDYLLIEQDWFGGAGPRRARLRVAPHDIDRAVAGHLEAKLARFLTPVAAQRSS